MALKNNTWKLNQWYDQDVAGNVSYSGNGEMWVWGRGNVGELAQNNRTAYSSPVQVPGGWYGANVFRRCGYNDLNHTTVVKNDGTLWMWGDNENGELGQNQASAQLAAASSPVQVGTETTWSGGSPLNKATAVVKTDGTLWSWGYNLYGMLGHNENNVKYSSPTQIPGTTWSQVGSGNLSTLAIKTDGTLWSWGAAHFGKLGQNQTQTSPGGDRSSPAQVGSGTDWACVSGMTNGGAATKTDGTLWAWGINNYGQLGQDNTTYRSSPVQIPGTTWGTTELTLLQGVDMCGSIKTDGTLWVWGQNDKGQLGQNNETNYSSPRQVGSETTWRSAVVLGTGSAGAILATKTDGTLWAWGNNHDGRCAQNSDPDNGGPDSYSSPVQIPGTDWKEMIGGAGGGLAAIKGD